MTPSYRSAPPVTSSRIAERVTWSENRGIETVITSPESESA
jgi:hypothetical protein